MRLQFDRVLAGPKSVQAFGHSLEDGDPGRTTLALTQPVDRRPDSGLGGRKGSGQPGLVIEQDSKDEGRERVARFGRLRGLRERV